MGFWLLPQASPLRTQLRLLLPRKCSMLLLPLLRLVNTSTSDPSMMMLKPLRLPPATLPTVRMLPPPRPLSRLPSTMLPPVVLLPSKLQPLFTKFPSQLPFLWLLQMLFHLLDIHMESTPSMFWELTPVMLLVCHMPPTLPILPLTHMLVSQSSPPPQLPNLLKNQ